jgi:uncharacterized protein YbjT (DUF2867 family)
MLAGMKVLVAGGTGLVGRQLLEQLATDADVEAVALVRRETTMPPGVAQRVVDFAALDAVDVGAVDVGFCTLGTTLAKAGSKAAFEAVDHDAVIDFAKLCRRAGARTFVLVTALGADPGSRIFYNAVKGRAEADVRAVGFEHLVILRPSILDGDREERRTGEAIGLALMRAAAPLMRGPLARYKPSRVRDVAAAMRVAAREGRSGIFEGPAIPALAGAQP